MSNPTKADAWMHSETKACWANAFYQEWARQNPNSEDVGKFVPLYFVPTETGAMAATVPAGWKLVPEESTPEMEEAGFNHVYAPTTTNDCEYVWSAMLKAAPQAPVAGQPAEPSPASPLSDAQIKAAVHSAVKAGKLSWAGYEKDEAGEYTVPVLSPKHYQLARVIESTLAAPKGDSNG